MSTGLPLEKQTLYSGLVTLDATGDKLILCGPCKITRFGFIQTTAATGTGLVLKCDSDLFGASRGDGDIGSVTPGVAPALNSGYYRELSTPYELKAGETATLEVTTAESAGDGHVFFEYIPSPFVGDAIENMTAKTS